MQYSQENTCGGLSFLIELQAWRPATVLKETTTKMFFCEYCENFKKTYFQEKLQTTASAVPASYC